MPWSPCVRLNYLVALRPSQLRTKPCSVKTTSNGWTALFGMQFLPPSRATSALRISELTCRLPGTKNHHSA
ncbi:hypothetical protein [Bathymodiolus platifrons methanotrophic gill symbiont]|uniref:hypothetical protein n=1 Tax=Bathymodiolus platifrons methanotrophic gill symbiont TaxID=113268 RepID=UPI001C8D55DD|nr:hypothetical protein [Bathymodiolus platifrons methanotrophic gill symbiont]